jgi:ribosomal protein S27AE
MEDKWQELRQLEKKRSDLIIKLTKIDEKKDMVSQEVYEKVKSEYEEKIKNIDVKMGENVDLIKEELQNISEQEVTLQSQEKDIGMQLEEIELRYSIGEYDEESYLKMSDEKKDARSTARDEIEKLKKRKKWLEDFVQVKDVEEHAEPEAPPAPPAAPPVAEPVAEPAEEPAVEPPAEPEPIAAEKEPEKEDTGIQIEEHILEETLPDEETKLDELLVEEEAVKQDIVEEAPVEEKVEPKAEKGKDAICPKCGHANALDSWYCEKCGAEILDSSSEN